MDQRLVHANKQFSAYLISYMKAILQVTDMEGLGKNDLYLVNKLHEQEVTADKIDRYLAKLETEKSEGSSNVTFVTSTSHQFGSIPQSPQLSQQPMFFPTIAFMNPRPFAHSVGGSVMGDDEEIKSGAQNRSALFDSLVRS